MKYNTIIRGWRVRCAGWLVFSICLAVGGRAERFVAPPGTPGGTGTPPFNTWTNAATNIQLAVNAAGAGETVWVSNGLYVLTACVDVAKAVTVRGVGSDPGAVTIDGGNHAGRDTTNACFYLNHTGAVVRCMTITNGWGQPPTYWGGAVQLEKGTLHDCWLTANRCPVYGGAVAVWDQSGRIVNCRIVSNECASAGGGFWFWRGGTVENSLIAWNFAKNGGGGMAQGGLIINCEITGNWSTNPLSGNYGGGGLKTLPYYTTNHVIIRNCLISGNRAASYGAGIYAGADTGYTNIVENCTIVSNVAGGDGRDGIMLNAPGGGMILQNTILYYNSNHNWHISAGTVTGANNCIMPAAGMPGTGNFTNAPVLLDLAGGNYRLAATSPCVDAGVNAAWMGYARDLDGHRRLINMRVDVGCYEFLPAGSIIMVR